MTISYKKLISQVGSKTHVLQQVCPVHCKHPYQQYLMLIDGFNADQPFCIKCMQEKELKPIAEKVKSEYSNRNYLKHHSLFNRIEEHNYTFDNFKAQSGSKEIAVKEVAHAIAAEYFRNPDKQFNTMLMGCVGAGKTHLAVAILNAVNDHINPPQKCLFLSVDRLIDKMRNYFATKTGKWSPEYVNELAKQANLVVLDDLGAETGNREATDFVQRTLFNIYESNQRVITTTNLNKEELLATYQDHGRVVSRMFEGSANSVINFENMKDKRLLK
jgi:DNA replication protein DnaC